MRPVLFVTCFSVGVFLMLFSSAYEPRPAQAFSVGQDTAEEFVDTDDRGLRTRPKLPSELLHETAIGEAETAVLTDSNLADEPVREPRPRHQRPAAATDDDPNDSWTAIKEPAGDDGGSRGASDPNLVGDWAEVVADAGADGLVWAGVPRIDLDGELSVGEELRYEWRQLSGPPLMIEKTDAAVTFAAGLPFGGENGWATEVYVFELTVRDAAGHESSDTVTVYAQPAPDLVLVPGGAGKSFTDKYFGNMQGVPLANFEARVSGPQGRLATFVIDADSPLNFDALESADFEMWYSDENGRHLYQFDVYQAGDETQTWLVFFVETEEQIPAVVRLGVDWYGD
ncbi:MAG: hypothetical protein JXO22_17515 [Phycisphaerae bacterium]|nr:hypothetical protein [Phycisphaerae bacterium]